MKDDITIPPKALEAGKDTAFNWLRGQMEDDVRVQHMTDDELTELVSAACLAMLKAWPERRFRYERNGTYPVVVLPFEETTND